jgi:hydrogenase maturation protease
VTKTTNPPEPSTGAPGAGVLIRVVGCGNPWASDDGAGIEVVRRLRASGRSECELLELPQAGVELMETLAGAQTVVYIDAVSSGAPAGTIHLVHLPAENIEPRALGSVSSHGWGLAEILRLMTTLGRPAPRMALVGIEIESAAPGAARSPAVEEAVRIIVERFPALCDALMSEENRAWQGTRRFSPGDESFPEGMGDPDKSGQFLIAEGGL